MNRRISHSLATACLIFVSVFSAAAQSSGPRVDLSLIVTDKDGKPLATIRKEDLHLFEGKVEQTILSVEPDTRPIDFALAIDASGSFNKLFVAALKAAGMIVRNVRPEDEIFIERFISNGKIEKVHDFSGDTKSLLKAVNDLYIEDGQSAVVDGIYMAADYVAEHNQSRSGRRKVVVVITDGDERNSYYSSDTLLKFLRTQGVQVFALGLTAQVKDFSPGTYPNARVRAETLLRDVARESGGQVFFARSEDDLLNNAVPQLLTYLRSQFLITYQSSDNSIRKGFRKVELKLDSPNDEKRSAITPRGYFFPTPSAPPVAKEKKQ
jgi:Ca-activated chloride channel homolog